MFRNLRFFRLDGDWPDSEDALSQKLEEAAFEPCGPLTERSSGWVPVASDAGQALARRVSGADLLQLRSQSRILPAAAIKEELEARVDDYRNRMGESPTPREKRRLKAETRDELLPKAMLKSDRIWGYVDLKEKIIGIDSAQEAVAERFLRRLRAPWGELPINPLGFREPVDELLTSVFLGGAPRQFVLGRECRMQDAADPGSKVRWTDFDLNDKSIRNHVAEGMRLTHLQIQYDNIASFVLDENAVVTKLKILGMDDDGGDDVEPLARFDAEFVLVTGILRRLLDDLRKLLGGFAHG